MKGWHYQSWRHSLAAKGIRTSFSYDNVDPQEAQRKMWEDIRKKREGIDADNLERKRIRELEAKGKHKYVEFRNPDRTWRDPNTTFEVSQDKQGRKTVKMLGDYRVYTEEDLPEIERAIESLTKNIGDTEDRFVDDGLGSGYYNQPTVREKKQGVVNVVGSDYFTEIPRAHRQDMRKLRDLLKEDGK